MKTLTSAEVQKNFGAVMDHAKQGVPVRVTRYGRPGAFVIADPPETEQWLRKQAARRLVQRLESLPTLPTARNWTQDDVNRLIDECFD